MRLRFIACGWLLLCIITNVAFSEEWGTLKGKFTYSGKPPAPKVLGFARRLGNAVPDERFLVGPKGGVANIVVWLRTKDVAVHPDAGDLIKVDATLKCKDAVFTPHVLPVQVGQVLKIKNLDAAMQSVNAGLVNSPSFTADLHADEEFSVTMKSAENLPVKVTNNVEPIMSAWLLVRPNPYFAVSDAEGKFEIKNLPAGVPLEFQVWHELYEPTGLSKAKINGENANWPRGRFTMELKPAENDLGEIMLEVGQFLISN